MEEERPPNRFGRRSPSFMRKPQGPVPVKEGEEYEVTIEAVGRKGDGMGKIENFVIFVPDTKAGDKVKVKIASIQGNFATATVVE